MPRKNKGEGKWDDLEVFTRKGAKLGNPFATITANSSIQFSSAFCYAANLVRAETEGKKYVVLMYSPKNNAIVFSFTDDEHALGKHTITRRGTVASVTCRSFLKAQGLNLDQIKGRYPARKEKIPKIGECWHISLNEKLEI